MTDEHRGVPGFWVNLGFYLLPGTFPRSSDRRQQESFSASPKTCLNERIWSRFVLQPVSPDSVKNVGAIIHKVDCVQDLFFYF